MATAVSVHAGNVEEVFTFQPPDAQQLEAYNAIRPAAMELVKLILKHVPPCADQQAAIRKVREAVMTANAGIALRGNM